MKEYRSIPGWRKVPLDLPCWAFEKLDGNNIRAEWNPKKGFYKFGSRTVLIDKNSPELGSSVSLFEETLAEPLHKLLLNNKIVPKIENAMVFLEYYGDSSFAGMHKKGEKLNLKIIDIAIHKKGVLIPEDFVNLFDGLPAAKLLYHGNFDQEFVNRVREGEFGQNEGIVAKGYDPKAKSKQHSLWMAKVKTNWWMQELRNKILNDSRLAQILTDNINEQGE